jgi:hypothetical protein
MNSPETFEDTVPYAMEVLKSGRGSGASIDSPFQLNHVHPLLATSVEQAVVSLLFQSQDWTPVERLYHKNGQVFEWRIKRQSGDVLPVFFDIGQVNDSAPVSDAVRQQFNQHSDTVPVPDATLVSRFPLVKVEARSAAEAADFIFDHLERAVRQGWQVGNAVALADGWRNDYELTRGSEKTKMSFDMRACLVLNSMDLTMLTLMAGKRRGETFVKQHARMLVEMGKARRAPPGSSLGAAAKTEKKNKVWAYFMAAIIFVSMPLVAAVVYHFTDSALYATIGFFSPIIIYWIWMAWLIMDTQSMIADSKRKFPDVER